MYREGSHATCRSHRVHVRAAVILLPHIGNKLSPASCAIAHNHHASTPITWKLTLSFTVCTHRTYWSQLYRSITHHWHWIHVARQCHIITHVESDLINLMPNNVINLITTDVINQDYAVTPAIMHLHLLPSCWLHKTTCNMTMLSLWSIPKTTIVILLIRNNSFWIIVSVVFICLSI